ncbi:MAG: SRPBCC family protein [Anaerolineae bacterium]|nr:SRPBCC family protein [Anaerolineae bacterium]MBL6965748.1 SRPBCC family protein [Anaerolineales bacterium]
MKYTCEISLDLPRQRVIELFDNPENLAKWQTGLKSFEYFEGLEGQPGAKSRLLYDEGGREIEMVETIIVRNLPDEFSATYEAKGVYNEISNFFHETGENQTRWVMNSEFKFSGLMRLMGIFMRGAFPKQTLKSMQSFKNFAESEGA